MTRRIISVVIPCRNCEGTIARLVEELRRQELPPGTTLEIIAVENHCTDGTSAILRALPVQHVVQRKRGPAAARNAGVRSAAGDIVLFLDSDTRPKHSTLLARHLATLDSRPDVGISGGAIVHDPEQRSILAFAENATGLFNWHDGLPERELTFQPAGNMAFRRELFDEVGALDESLLTLEDFEWNQRVLGAGYKVRFDPEACVYITGRESLRAILAKFFSWGRNIHDVYLPGRRSQVWIFPDSPVLFRLNAPLRMLNETWVTIKRWYPVAPARTIILTPLFLLFRCAWAAGLAAGAPRRRKP